MIKILLIETSPISKKSDVTVHVRNSMVLFDYLNSQSEFQCKLVDSSENLDINEQFNFIIVVSATFYFNFSNFNELISNQNNCKLGWITNEHDLFQNDFLKQIGTDFIISNFESWGVKKAHKYNNYLLTNLNALQAKESNPFDPNIKQYDSCYYGTWRKYREKYYQKYLIGDMILSTSGKNIKKYLLSGCDCLLTQKFSWEDANETLNAFKSTLYIEDTITHKLFNHLANRFYEAMFCNVAIFFDKSCKGTIDKSVAMAGYVIDDYWIVDSYDELMSKTKEISNSDILNNIKINNTIALEEKRNCLNEIKKFLIDYY